MMFLSTGGRLNNSIVRRLPAADVVSWTWNVDVARMLSRLIGYLRGAVDTVGDRAGPDDEDDLGVRSGDGLGGISGLVPSGLGGVPRDSDGDFVVEPRAGAVP